MQPRNTLVLLDVIEQASKQVGKFTIPNVGNLFAEAEVIAIGPGCIQAEGGRTETFDLKVGQRVLVKYKEERGRETLLSGIKYAQGDKFYYLFEQMSIVAIIAEPSQARLDPAEDLGPAARQELGLN